MKIFKLCVPTVIYCNIKYFNDSLKQTFIRFVEFFNYSLSGSFNIGELSELQFPADSLLSHFYYHEVVASVGRRLLHF